VQRRTNLRQAGVALVALTLALSACTGSDDDPEEPAPTTEDAPAALTLGLYGTPDTVADAFVDSVTDLNTTTATRQVTVDRPEDGAAAWAQVRAGEADVPDLFLASYEDLAWLDRSELIQPVDSLMQERDVDFGDGFSLDAVGAFSVDSRLMCMPYGVDPLAVYYNTDLVDFDAMAEQDLPVPSEARARWTFDMFEAAAEFASNPDTGTKGVHVDPTLDQIAPFVLSGGGAVFADEEPPTSLALSDESSRSALERALLVLRRPDLTLTTEQLQQAPALDWFTQGELGMMVGPRSLTPTLRETEGLDFDVMPMPELDSRATVGNAVGICMSADTENPQAAADVIVDLVSVDVMSRVAEAGYIVPSNLEVAQSEAYLQTDERPENSGSFFAFLRYTQFLPPLEDRAALDAAVEPLLDRLFNSAILNPETIEAITLEIDEESQLLLGGEAAQEQEQEQSSEGE